MLDMYNNHMTSQNLNIDTLDYRDHKELYLKLKEEERETLDIDFELYTLTSLNQDIQMFMKVYMQRWCMPTNVMKIQI